MRTLLESLIDLPGDQTITHVGLRSDMPAWLLPALIAAAVLVSALLYARETAAPVGRRVMLAILRAALFTIVLVMLFRPVVGLEKRSTVRQNLLVMVDRSESMGIADSRVEPGEIADAALAVGKALPALPATQATVARAETRGAAARRLLDQARWSDAVREMGRSRTFCEEALAGLGSLPAGDAAAVAVVRPLLERSVSLARAAADEAAKIEAAVAGDRGRAAALLPFVDDVQVSLATVRSELRRLGLEAPVQVSAKEASISRLDLARGLLARLPSSGDDALGDRFDVSYFTFGEEPAQLPTDVSRAESLATLEPTAAATRAENIRAAVDRFRGQPIAGVVTLGDGAFNDDDADPRSVAAALGEQGIPLYTVGLGLSTPRDVALGPPIVQDAFFPKDMITTRLQVSGNGYDGAISELRVLLGGREVATKRVELKTDPRLVDITFEVPEGKGGLLDLEIVAPEQPGETTVANNRVVQPVKVLDQKINVLYVEGRPRWEFRYLSTVLDRDRRLAVKYLLSEGDKELPAVNPQYLARFPQSTEEAFVYDLVILGDIHPWFFSRQQLATLQEMVQQRGSSLLLLSGARYAPAAFGNTPVAELLPVKVAEGVLAVAPTEYPSLTDVGRRSFAMLGVDEADNQRIWSLLRPIDRVPRLEGVKAGAVVVAELPASAARTEPYPLVAWHRSGTGKVMFLGTDELWRLRFKTGDRYHAAFWNKAIQFLALSRLLGGNKRINLEADLVQLRPGQRTNVRAYVLDDGFQPVKSGEYRVTVEQGGEPPREIVLVPVPGTPGLFQGPVSLPREGRYTVLPPTTDRDASTVLELVVAASNRERAEPAAQPGRLRQMAELSGGQYLTAADWPALGGLLDGRPQTMVESRDVDLWDHWLPYAAFVACAGAEWFLRRRSYLM